MVISAVCWGVAMCMWCTINVCLCFNAFRGAVGLPDIYTPAQRSSPRMNAPVLHISLVLYRPPNRLHRPQEVGLTECVCEEHVHVYTQQEHFCFCFCFTVVFFFCSWCWPWRTPTFYWRTEPHVSQHIVSSMWHKLYYTLHTSSMRW